MKITLQGEDCQWRISYTDNRTRNGREPTLVLEEIFLGRSMKSTKEVLTMKKVLGTFLLFTLLLSAGTIYASSNSAQNLSDWYKNSFQKESRKLESDTATGITLVFKEVNTFLKESKNEIDAAIATFGDKLAKASKTGVEEYQTQTINSLYDTVVELEKENFDDQMDKLNIEAEISKDFESIVEEVFSE